MEDILAVKNALESENKSLKDVITQFQANKKALEDTVQEMMANNINQRAQFVLFQRQIDELNAKIASKDEEIKKLTPAPQAPAQENLDAA